MQLVNYEFNVHYPAIVNLRMHLFIYAYIFIYLCFHSTYQHIVTVISKIKFDVISSYVLWNVVMQK